MHLRDTHPLFSASDLVNFLECEHTATLGLINLETPLTRAAEDEANKLIQDKASRMRSSSSRR